MAATLGSTDDGFLEFVEDSEEVASHTFVVLDLEGQMRSWAAKS